MQFVYFPCISNFTDVQTWDTYCKFRDLYGVLQDHVLEKRMFEIMSQEMKRVSSNEEQIQLFCQCFFDVKSSSKSVAYPKSPESVWNISSGAQFSAIRLSKILQRAVAKIL